MTNNIIDMTYGKLHDDYNITGYEFSTDWLGKTKTYYSYLNSKGAQASNDCLLSMWGQAIKKKREAIEYIETAEKDQLASAMKRRVEYYDDLANKIEEAIKEMIDIGIDTGI